MQLGKINLTPQIRNFVERIQSEREKRSMGEQLPFGVTFLDEALGGIRRDDFVLIGARTGAGKTQLVSTIAMHNASLEKKVFFFALEAAEDEIERRIKYQIISNLIYSNKLSAEKYKNFNFMDWYNGKYNDELLTKLEVEVEGVWAHQYESLSIIYRESGKDFTIERLEKQMFELQDQASMFLIDHLMFFDFEDQNETRAMKRIIKKISDIAQLLKKPVILVAHLRKSDRSNKALIPSEDEFMGTSDIVKIPSKIITLASVRDWDELRLQAYRASRRFPTYMRIAKCRTDGSRCFYPAVVIFSSRTNTYEPGYELGELNFDETEWKPLSKQVPYWAKSNKHI